MISIWADGRIWTDDAISDPDYKSGGVDHCPTSAIKYKRNVKLGGCSANWATMINHRQDSNLGPSAWIS